MNILLAGMVGTALYLGMDWAGHRHLWHAVRCALLGWGGAVFLSATSPLMQGVGLGVLVVALVSLRRGRPITVIYGVAAEEQWSAGIRGYEMTAVTRVSRMDAEHFADDYAMLTGRVLEVVALELRVPEREQDVRSRYRIRWEGDRWVTA